MAATASAERFPAWPTPKSQHDRSRTPVREAGLSTMRPKSSTRQRTCGARWPVWRSVVCCSTAAKSAVIVCCAAIATTACSFQATSTQPSTAPPTSRVDSLIVSIEDVRRIANYEELAAHFQTDLREPPEADTNVRAPVVWWAAVIAPSEPTGQSSVARVTTALPTTSDRAGRSWSRRLARR